MQQVQHAAYQVYYCYQQYGKQWRLVNNADMAGADWPYCIDFFDSCAEDEAQSCSRSQQAYLCVVFLLCRGIY